MHILGMRSWALLWCLLTRLWRRLLNLLGLVSLLSLLGLLGLLGLHSQKVLLLEVLRLPMRHLLKLHLRNNRAHPRILHSCYLGCI
jgi:hypothetical protein